MNAKDKMELRRITRLPIPKKVKLLKDERYRDLFLNNHGNIPLKMHLIRNNLYIDRLENVKEQMLKLTLINHGHYIYKLKNDKDTQVRKLIAKKGLYLNELKSDKDWHIRKVVGGFGIYDKKHLKNKSLREALVYYYLRENYSDNIDICKKCKQCRWLFCSNYYRYDDSFRTDGTWYPKTNCPYKMEHTVLSKGFVDIEFDELLKRTLEYCDNKNGENIK